MVVVVVVDVVCVCVRVRVSVNAVMADDDEEILVPARIAVLWAVSQHQ